MGMGEHRRPRITRLRSTLIRLICLRCAWVTAPRHGLCSPVRPVAVNLAAVNLAAVRLAAVRLAALGGLLFSLLATPATAQIIPPAAEPRDPRDRIVPPRPEIRLPDLNIPAYRGIVPPGADVVQLDLKDVAVTGSTVLESEALRAPFEPLIGRTVSLDAVYAAASALQNRYRSQGYILTRVVVPAQRITAGVVQIRVVEGFISEVLIEGDIGPVRRQVERTVSRVTRLRPVRNTDLERYLLLANDIPGISAVGVLRPGAGEPGASQLLVRVRRKRVDGFATFNNRESDLTGPLAAAVGAGGNGLTPFGDRLEGLYFLTIDSQEPTRFTEGNPFEQSFGLIAYETLLNGEGTRLRGEASLGVSRPGADLAVLDIAARVSRYAAAISHPIVRTRAFDLTGTVSFQSILERTSIAGTRVARDKLSILGLDIEADFQDTLFRIARTQAQFNLRRGVEIFGATSDDDGLVTRPEGTSEYTTVSGYVSRTQSLSNAMDLFLEATGQYAFNTLLSQAEFRIGGDSFGRAFDPSQAAGEHGWGVAAELRFTDDTGWRILPDYQLYAFADAAQVRNEDEGFPPQTSLWSTGAGIRTNLRPVPWTELFLDLEYAHGESFGSGPEFDTRNQAYVRFTAQF